MPKKTKAMHVARIDGGPADFEVLFEAAKRFAKDTDRWVEIQPGHMSFHFESEEAYSQFLKFSEGRKMKPGSEKFQACRRLVHDNGFEAKIASDMVLPLLKNALNELKTKYLRDSGIFLRRALTRYAALVACRLLEEPNESGKTGITASIASLLEMAEAESLLPAEKIAQLRAKFEKIKADAADGKYDLVKSLRDLRNIHVAHSLIPWKEPTDVWAHHLVDFIDALFQFVTHLETALAEATGITLGDLETNAKSFADSAGQFWRAQTTLKFLADGEPPGGKLAQ